MIGELIGTVGTIAGGIMGAQEQGRTNKTNTFINIMNAMMRERERLDQKEEAGKIRREDKLGGIDAQGNRTYFDPDRGWVVTPSAKNAEIQSLQDAEQVNVLNLDLPMRRKQMQSNFVKQLRDGEEEDKYLREMQYAKVDPAAIRNMLFSDAQRGIDGSFDEATAAALRGSIRQGGASSADILSKMARERSEATGDAFSKTGVQALQMADSMSKSNMGQLQNLVNFFGGRARGMPAVNYRPDNGDETGNNTLKAFMSASQNSEGMMTDAAGKKGGNFDYVTPNFGYANTVAQGGKSLGNSWDSFNKPRQVAGNTNR